MYPIRLLLGTVLTAWAVAVAAQPPTADEAPADGAAADQDPAKAPSHTWIEGLQAGIRQAQAKQKPLLVFAGSDTCPWCRRLRAELDAETLARELGAWTLAHVDVDRQPADAREIGVGPVPALRILNVRGIRVASLEGLVSSDELVGWLRKNYEQATQGADHTLVESGAPNVLAIIRLVRQLDQRDPTQREAAIKRLTANREQAASPVLKAFREGNLATRLAALEILQQWQAPLDGVDPWRPETITPERLTKLDDWRDSPPEAAPSEPAESLSDDDLARAREQIDRLLKTDGVLAAAIRGRLARFGPALLPEVYERLKDIQNDQQRERLLALRYRLVASDSLIVRWPAGIVRLASSNVDERRQAAEQLAELATADDQALLLELFSDSDSLIRELSLRSLDHLGGTEARTSLARLLNDPEPNVRAAVLKRLAEDAPAAMVTQVADYVKNEQDPDLLVHAIRYFKATPRAKSVEALLPLLKHESWQVRAEAAESVGKAAYSLKSNSTAGLDHSGLRADAFAALIDLLADPDPFVVSRAVEGLQRVDMVIAVEPLVKAALTHTDLAPQIVEILTSGDKKRPKALPHVQKFRSHEVPEVRAAALTGLAEMTPDTMAEWLPPGLRDESTTVRLAATEVVFEMLDDLRNNERRMIIDQQLGQPQPMFTDSFGAPRVIVRETVIDSSGAPRVIARESFLERTVKSLFGGFGKKDEVKEAEVELEVLEPDVDLKLDPEPDLKERPPLDAIPEEGAPLFDSPRDTSGGVQEPGKEPSEAAEPAHSGTTEAGEDEPKETGDTDDGADDPGRKWDQWLADFKTGDQRPKWTNEIIDPLTEMFGADDPDERLAAARVLTALGERGQALPILRDVAAAQPHLSGSVAEILPWLPWQQRELLFDQLMSQASSDDYRGKIIESMSQAQDLRTAARFWSLLEAPDLSQDMAASLDDALAAVYFGESYYADRLANKALRGKIRAAAELRTQGGSELQRLVALTMIAQVDAEQAAPVARRMADDQANSPELRRDAFQVLLAVSSPRERQQMAAAAMAGDDADRQMVAIRFFVNGEDGLHYLRGYAFSVEVNESPSTTIRSGQPIIPAVPKGIDKEVLLPFLKHQNLEIRAFAGYLLALLEDPQGMPMLIEYWRQQPDLESRMKLVYRAIAVLDDPNYVPLLREIYKKLERYYISEFYWTIRIMSGPEILSLRKQIRAEVDPDDLQ